LPPAAQAFLPKGWKVLALVSADLNSDGRADLVFVREEQDPGKVKRDETISPAEQNYNPRVLVVLLAEADGYRKLAEYPRLIPPAFDLKFSCFEDRFAGISVKKGVLTVTFRYWASAGSWTMSMEHYKFRLESGRLRLIGRDKDSFSRASGEQEAESINYLTGQRKQTTGGNEFTDKPSHPKDSWDKVEIKKPVYLEDLLPCGQDS
jgi:hypothetical protein